MLQLIICKSKNNNFKLEAFPNKLWDKDISVSLKGIIFAQKYLVLICQSLRDQL